MNVMEMEMNTQTQVERDEDEDENTLQSRQITIWHEH
jgi:hypothetical protein